MRLNETDESQPNVCCDTNDTNDTKDIKIVSDCLFAKSASEECIIDDCIIATEL